MKQPRAPQIDQRRAKEFESELFARARAWIPSWGMEDDDRDFGRALLKIAARFHSEVAERLDRGGDKMRLGLLDWLAVQGKAARPARLPVVFKLADSARDPVLATKSARLQVEVKGAPVILETECDVYLLPGQLKMLVGVDADRDAFYLPPPGLSSLAPLEPLPTQWRLKSYASAGATKLQLDPELGLAADLLVELGGLQYRIVQSNKDIATIDPPLTQDQAEQSLVTKITAFAPFDDAARNRQQHVLYLGHNEMFDIEAPATIEIVGAKGLTGTVNWQYWGKADQSDEVTWQPLALAAEQQTQPDSIVLSKPKGSIEQFEVVKDSSSRWIRAVISTVPADEPPPRVDALEIRINCRHGAAPPPPSAAPAAAPSAEGMTNTTPLVLNGVFFPLGKEPRQFDAFYLGSKEAFSKKAADVELDFQMADTTFRTLTAVLDGAFAGTVLTGVARDGALHLLEVNATTGAIGKYRAREPLRPRSSDGNADTPGVALDGPKGRLPLWHGGPDLNGFLVAASAGDAVWVWRERSDDQNASKWEPVLGSVPAIATNATAQVDDLVFLAETSTLFALRGGQLSKRQWPNDTQWTPVPTTDGSAPVVLQAIVLILNEPGLLITSTMARMVGISDDKKLYSVTPAGVCSLLPPIDVNRKARPVAVRRTTGDLIVALAHSSLHDVAVFHSAYNEKVVPFDEIDAETTGFEAVLSGTDLYFLAAVKTTGGGYLASWAPHTSSTATIEVFRSGIPSATGTPGGAPTKIGARVVIPGSAGELLAAEFDLTRRLNLKADIGEGIFAPGPTPAFQPGDLVTRDIGTTNFASQLITEVGTTLDGRIFYLLDQPFAAGANGALNGLRVTGPSFVGDLTAGIDTLALDNVDNITIVNSLVRVGTVIHKVTAIDSSRVATVAPPPAASATGVPYRSSTPINGVVAPFIRLNALNNDWDAARLEHATLVFAGASPHQQGKAFSVMMGNRPVLVELSHAWTTAPAVVLNADFVLDAAAGPWASSLADTTTNPELSWEYWNGTGWWKLETNEDETLHLKKSGKLTFKVPLDLSPTDWSGKTNHWIRARLIGGDYGREKVTVKTSPPDLNGVTTQMVERSSRDIHAPSVVKLGISYEICKSVPPTFVLTQDSGSMRDQSDANRTAGAMVEAFVPVAVLLGRLSGAAPASGAGDECPPDCNCRGTTEATASAGTPAGPSGGTSTRVVPAPGTSAPVSGRAIYLGFDAPLFGEPVNVLLLVEERSHDGFAPMTVEALIADRFVPIVVNDATRALGESGVLSLAFPLEPKPREMFGQTLTWLRLTPTGSPMIDWKPKLLGAYLNAVWARAAETLTRELVGSSRGEPNLTLYLARPPVLHDTLELRVKEPLGEEEREELKAKDENQVLSEVENLPGDWVLWRRVVDPEDEPATERVYALDEATGEIRFGDGRHGRIPPVGRDSIVAFKYRRTETGAPDTIDVPANGVTARTPLNLVSPLDGVEAVFAADQAAGGAPAESTERVLRFGVANIRHRERALTARDIEDLALESSPDIAQARCLPRKGFVRLVVVMRGADPMPSAAQVRELSRLLLAAAPPSLSARQALRIVGPAVRRLRVDLRLRVASLDDAGAVARDAKQQIVTLFDTSTGGPDQDGWSLGENPTEGDIAMALARVARVESIAGVALREVRDGSDRPWSPTIQPNELAMLDKDVVRVEFETLEVTA